MDSKITAAIGSPPHVRRFDHDVTNTVNVSSVDAVRNAVSALLIDLWPDAILDELWVAFHDFQRLFEGRMFSYEGCDTVYHDIQHTLDVTLAMARLVSGYERSVADEEKLGPDRAVLGIICALFHDAGYIRPKSDYRYRNGAEYTKWHVSRSARFLRSYLPKIGMFGQTRRAAEMVHFTGYEKKIEEIRARLRTPEKVLLSVGLSRAWPSNPDRPPVHWLQVNNLHFEGDPTWSA